MIGTKDTYTVKEFAEKIKVYPQTVYDWIEKGYMPVDPNGGKKILKFEMDMVHDISILTNKKFSRCSVTVVIAFSQIVISKEPVRSVNLMGPEAISVKNAGGGCPPKRLFIRNVKSVGTRRI